MTLAIPSAPRGYRLQIHLSVLVVSLVLLSGLSIGGFSYIQSRNASLAGAEDSFRLMGREAAVTVEALYGPVQTLVDVIASSDLVAQRGLEGRLRALPELTAALERNPRIAALYAGYDDGAFFLVRPVRDDRMRSALGAPAGARFLVQSVNGGGTGGLYLWLDADRRELARQPRPDYRFDPRTRPWYQAAMGAAGQVLGDPYAFFTTREVGKTVSLRTADGRAVVGADLTLAELSALLEERTRQLPGNAQIAVFDRQGVVVAHRDPGRAVMIEGEGGAARARAATVAELGSPVLAQALRLATGDTLDRATAWNDGSAEWRVLVTRLYDAAGRADHLAVAIPLETLLEPANRGRTRTLVIVLLILAAAVPAAWMLARSVALPLERLARHTAALRRFDFGEPAQPVSSRILEVEEVARSLDATRATIRRFLEASRAVSAEQRFEALIDRVLDETLAISAGSAGTVRLVSEDGRALRSARVRKHEGAHPPGTLAELPIDADLPVARAARERRVTVDAFTAGEAPRAITEFAGQTDVTVLSVPLYERRGALLGVLSLMRTGPDAREPVSQELISFLEALAGVLAVAIENQKLLRAQKDLLDALIQLVAGSIDAKSPYTGGHCQRVPALTRMLAEAACEATEGPFAEFRLTEEQWEAVHIASWLHDCGKVTTPEYVVDKATKLETIHDRLHEVRMRFEVLKRDADVEFWKGVAQGGEQAALAAARDALHRDLDEEFAFVAECNLGGEFMAPEKVERLKAIAARTWMRTLDDRIGLAHEELKRKAAVPPAPLPAPEPLLADRPEHLFTRPAAEMLPADNPWGFRLKVPGHKFNRGELHNLSVARGTLTDEDRYLINDHIVQTIRMLTALPFPAHLRAVPEIAGGHHEKMDGTGYPRGLSREQMSLPARMMAIADIFEALTASDRPYKKAKTLSESIKIMGFMKKDGHIDPDLFELFLRSGIHLRYAERFLAPEQIDEVDITPYLKAA